MRADSGALVRQTASGGSADEARAALLARVRAASTNTKPLVTESSTIAEAAAAWLPTIRARAANGLLAWSTYESYEHSVRCVLLPVCGGVTLGALTVGRCDRIIQGVLGARGISAARRAWSVVGLICGFAVRDDAMLTNPVRDVTRLPTSPKKTSILDSSQIDTIRDLMEHWRDWGGSGPRPNYRAVVDGIDIVLGTSARAGECIGLRRCDIDMTTSPPTILIDGTIVQNREQGIVQKEAPNRTRQHRRVVLPTLAAAAIRRRLALAGPGPEALLFPTKPRRPMSVSNFERLLRSFIVDNAEELRRIG